MHSYTYIQVFSYAMYKYEINFLLSYAKNEFNNLNEIYP